MPRFFRIYDFKAAGAFRGTPLKLANGWLLAGSAGNEGIIALIDFNGNPVWQKKYAIAGKKVSFNSLLQTGGKIFVTGVIIVGDKRSDHLLLQIDANGNLAAWPGTGKTALAFHSDFTRFVIDAIDLFNGQLLFTSWFNQTASTDFGELFVVNLANGQLAQAAKFYAVNDTQIYDIAVVNDAARRFAYLVGVDNSSNGLFVSIDYQGSFAARRSVYWLNVASASLTQVFANAVLPNAGHLIAGTYAQAGQIGGDTVFVAQLTHNDSAAGSASTLSVVKIFGLRFGTETKRIQRIVKRNDKWWIIGYLTTSIRPFVICLDQNLNIEWVKIIQTDNKSVFSDAELYDNNTLVLSGYLTNTNNQISPALLYTDSQLASCQTQTLTWERIDNPVLQITPKTFAGFDLFPNGQNYAKTYFMDVVITPTDAQPASQCPEKEFAFFSGEKMSQSPFLNVQAAGSLGTESTAGIHLRWAFLQSLGDKHLPKGNFPSTPVNFNKPDDFVQLYRIPYSRPVATVFALTTSNPIFRDHAQARWHYNVPGLGKVDVWFLDKNKYNPISNNNLSAFWAAYQGGIVEIEIRETLAFATEIQVTATGNYALQVETLSAAENHPLTPLSVTARQVFSQASPTPRRLLAENLRKVRYRCPEGSLSAFTIAFETYDNFLMSSVKNNAVEYIGAFALTQDDKLAFNRLEDKPRTIVHEVWKKYNQDALVNGLNYQKRWNKIGGLKYGIGKYLSLSNTASNPTATEQVKDDPDLSDTNGKTIMVSYLDMLQIAATDYHVARMLGLGYLDTPKGTIDTAYLYLIEYMTNADLSDGNGVRPVQHLYLSLPTARKDQRFPEEVVVKNITYGLNDHGDIEMTDVQGYTPDGKARYINIFTALKTPAVLGDSFFVSNVLFQASNQTRPIFTGLEYKKASDKDWRKPEIAHHSELADPFNPNSPKLYLDTKGVPETAVLLFQEDGAKPALIHEETDPGIHYYAAYPINIFSRSGEPVLTAVGTDETKFIKRNTLMPPSDVRVQLIQKEDDWNLILTSADEQKMLQALAQNKDNTLVRLTFNYGYIQDTNYDFGSQFEIFFRQEMADQIIGGITDIQALNTKQSEVTGKDYTFVSNSQTHKPLIPAAKISRYIGGAFVYDGKRFEIKNVQNSGNNYPKFTLQNIVERSAITNGSQQTLTLSYIGLSKDSNKPFTAIENMANAANWGNSNPLSLKIDMDASQWTTKTEIQGNSKVQVRGIWAKAKINIFQITHEWIDGDGNPQKLTKDAGYTITFDTFRLNKHKQSTDKNQAVNWYNGVIRIPHGQNAVSKISEMKPIPVFRIDQTYDPVTNTPSAPLILYAGDDTLELKNIKLDTFIEVNFYPGYRTYLLAEPSKGFQAPAIMPTQGTGSKTTLLGMRTVDTNNKYTSDVCPPVVLTAQEIISPAEAGLPTGPEYATPPDIYNKSTYTLSLKFKQNPFAVAVYRADINALLGGIYKPETARVVKNQLAQMQPDQHWVDRIKDLVSSVKGDFKAFPDTINGGSYQFPIPDNLPADPSNEPPSIKFAKAIRSLFVPITKQPLLWQDIQKSTTITQEFPARWDAAKKSIVFTDFTLDGGMNTAYFYFIRDVSSRMEMGPPSKIWGPVQLVNSRPPSALIISKVLSVLGTTEQKAAIHFELLSPPTRDNINKIRVYRANNALDALHLRTMEQILEVDLSTSTTKDGIVNIYDEFAGTEVPYGDPLHYRLVGVQTIRYKDANGAAMKSDITSLPTKAILGSAAEAVNPVAPELQYSFLKDLPDRLLGVEISWPKTTYKGRYFLFKISNTGQWVRIKETHNTNNQAFFVVNLADTTLKDNNLICLDTDGKKIYHHFKVVVESASGLMSIETKVLTIGI